MTEHGISIYPYIEADGVRTMADSFLAGLYERTVHEGFDRVAFVDGSIRSVADFLGIVRNMADNRFFVFADEAREVLGMFWATNFEGRACRSHFAFYREAGRRRLTVAMGRMGLEYMLHAQDEAGYVLDSVEGLTPVSNRLACRFVRKIGMRIIGEVPNRLWNHWEGRSESAQLSICTRETLAGKEG